MILKQKMFKKVTIVGVGLMGGSLGLALKKYGLAKEVVGLSYRQSSLVQAIKNKAIDIGLTDISKAIKNAELVVMAAPVESIVKLFPSITPHLKRNCIVTDMGSAKVEIVEAAEKHLQNSSFFIGSHPLVGSEKKGAEFADPDLFDKAMCVITPNEKTNKMALGKIKHLWEKLGMKVKTLSPERHDEILGQTSHLPHLVAYGLMNAINEDALEIFPQGLKDATRIAASHPKMWSDICMSNSQNIVSSLDRYIQCLSQMRKAIVDKNENLLIDLFSKTKIKRDTIK